MTATSAGTPRQLSSLLQQIQAPVREHLDRVAVEMHEILTADLPLIQEVSKHLLQTRGKLFRPTLSLLASMTDGRDEPRAVTLAAGIEIMHVATLIHDDSVDHSALRRGLPTINTLFSDKVSVIMGDLLYSRGLRALVSLGELSILRILTDVTGELAMGEMQQLSAVDRLGFTEKEYFALIRAKTACLLESACETGAIIGAPMYRASLARYGDRLGMVFQMADDILDYTENAAITGKPGGLDLKDHKVTLPLIAVLPRLSPAARKRVDLLFATESPSDELVAEVQGLVVEAGGIDTARQRGEQFMNEADAALEMIPESPARASLAAAITFVMERRS